MRILITGGSGFIGSGLVRFLVANGHQVFNYDKLTYAANPNALKEVETSTGYQFLKADIVNAGQVREVLNSFRPEIFFHLAAESHVDRSINSADEFVTTNIVGTFSLLKESLHARETGALPDNFRFIHVSTDEVYGSLNLEDPSFTEQSPYLPNSPYSASKASSDLLVRSWIKTHNFPAIITHCSNNYGPFQNPEKLIPLMISNAWHEKDLPVYGDGKNVRDWIHVEDHVRALVEIAVGGKLGETYNIGGDCEVDNLSMVRSICELMDTLRPRAIGRSHSDLIKFVGDRKGHDFRYSISNKKIRGELRWQPRISLKEGLKKTVEWYIKEMQ